MILFFPSQLREAFSPFLYASEMDVTREKRLLIEACFASIGGMKSFACFSRFTPEQQKCVDFVRGHRDEIFATKGRDRYLNEVVLSITGTTEDDDEAICEATFSQYRFYRTYVNDLLFFPERFDFLMRCVEECVAVVAQPNKFLGIMDRLLTADKVEPVPDAIMNYERLLEEDEERRIESFTLRKDWACKVPHYMDIALQHNDFASTP